MITFPDDYVDRGPRSLDVIEQLKMGFPLLVRYLRGNHDQILLEFLSDPQFGEDWWRLGGIDIAEISVGRRFDRTRFITT